MYSEYHPDIAYSEFSEFFVEEYDTAFPEIQKKVGKKINAFKPIGNQGYSEILEKETNCAKNPPKKGLTILKRLL